MREWDQQVPKMTTSRRPCIGSYRPAVRAILRQSHERGIYNDVNVRQQCPISDDHYETGSGMIQQLYGTTGYYLRYGPCWLACIPASIIINNPGAQETMKMERELDMKMRSDYIAALRQHPLWTGSELRLLLPLLGCCALLTAGVVAKADIVLLESARRVSANASAWDEGYDSRQNPPSFGQSDYPDPLWLEDHSLGSLPQSGERSAAVQLARALCSGNQGSDMTATATQVQVSGQGKSVGSAAASYTHGDWGYLSSRGSSGGWCDLWMDFTIAEPSAFLLRAETAWTGQVDQIGNFDFARVEFQGYGVGGAPVQFGRLYDGSEYPARTGVASGVLPPGRYKIFAQCTVTTFADPLSAPWYGTDDGSASYQLAFSLSTVAGSSPPVINTQPQSTSVCSGSSLVLSVAASGADTYQWFKDGHIIAGATGATLTVPNAQPADAGDYAVELFSGAGTVMSDPARVTVLTPPVPGSCPLIIRSGQVGTIAASRLVSAARDPEGNAITLVAVDSVSAQGGTVRLEAGTISYTPKEDYTGDDSFQYTLSDSQGASATGTVRVRINAPSSSPNQLGVVAGAGGSVTVRFAGIPTLSYDIQASSNLLDWVTIGTTIAGVNGVIEFTDPDAATYSGRFYRTLLRL